MIVSKASTKDMANAVTVEESHSYKGDFWFVNSDNGEVRYQYMRSPQ
jgi:hypothetical protein